MYVDDYPIHLHVLECTWVKNIRKVENIDVKFWQKSKKIEIGINKINDKGMKNGC